jgi:hypothetical protein
VQMPSLFAAGGQLGAYRFEVHIPAAGQWFAPQQGAVQVDQRCRRSVMACTRARFGFEFRGQSRIRMVWARLGAVGDDEESAKSTRLPHQPGLNRDNPSMQIQFTKCRARTTLWCWTKPRHR